MPNARLSDLPVQLHFDDAVMEAAEEVARLVIRKQHDYGKSNILNNVLPPELAIAVRLSDKLNRLVNLVNSGADPEHESLLDTANDIAGYGLILKMHLEGSFTLPLRNDDTVE